MSTIKDVQVSELREAGFLSRLLAFGMVVGPMAAPFELATNIE
jgi:hypothetical protein